MNEGKTQHYIFVNVKGRSVPAANNTLNQVGSVFTNNIVFIHGFNDLFYGDVEILISSFQRLNPAERDNNTDNSSAKIATIQLI